MLQLNCKIEIGLWSFSYVTNITINESIDNFTRTATIILPQKWYENTAFNLFREVKIGDPVTIKLGYYPNLETRFKGYVSKRVPNSPLEIYCECESFKYKQRILEPVSQDDTTLHRFISAVYGRANIYDPFRKIGNWRVKKSTTFLKVLDELRSTFGTSAYWDDSGQLNIDDQLNEISVLKASFYYDTEFANIIDLSSMYFQDAAEFNQVVYGISTQDALKPDGKPIDPIEIYSYYDVLGNIQSTPFYNGFGNINTFKIPYLTAADLTKLCESRLKNLNYTGYSGDFKTFGEPVIKVNDDIQIINKKQAEMEGRYRVRSVMTDFGINEGYRQTIQVARKTGEVVI